MLERLRGTIDKSVAAVSVKSESFVESSRVRMAITNTQKNMDEAIHALGAMVYHSWSAGGVNMEALEAECRKVQSINAEIMELKARLEKIKATEDQILGSQKRPAAAAGSVFCTNCGRKLDASASFCDECGTPVKV